VRRGSPWFRLPLFIWSHYAHELDSGAGHSGRAITLLLLMVENIFHVGVFDPALGGDPVFVPALVLVLLASAVYIMVLPGFAVISEVITCFSRKPIFGYKFIAFSSIAIAIFGFLVWGHHLFVSSQSAYASLAFSVISFLVAIPSAIKVFNWTATLYKGSITFNRRCCMCWAFSVLFTIGGLTGLHLAPRRPTSTSPTPIS
jgi:cytochrome c oxidase subunit 1